MMRVLITGANGQLGSELVDLYGARASTGGDVAVLGLDLPDLDITARESVAEAFSEFAPDVVINCAAWTAVDAAEEDEEAALKVNGDGPRILAHACRDSGALLVQVSTDYVFSGEATQPYAEDAAPNPKTAYGRTKLEGEIAVAQVLPNHHYIVRTAWLYGRRGNNFVKTMLCLEQENETVRVVDDQIGQPTFAGDLATHIALLIDTRPAAGIFHATNSGAVSWHGFAREIFRLVGADPARVIAVASEEFARPAVRPAYSVLGHANWRAAGMPEMRLWSDALGATLSGGFMPNPLKP